MWQRFLFLVWTVNASSPDKISVPFNKQNMMAKQQAFCFTAVCNVEQKEFCCLFFRRAWISESQHMVPSHLRRWGHPVTVGMAQCDRCSCGPARQANKIIALICHLIPLSTDLRPQNMHNMVIIYRHLQTLGLGGWGKKKPSLCVYRLKGSF